MMFAPSGLVVGAAMTRSAEPQIITAEPTACDTLFSSGEIVVTAPSTARSTETGLPSVDVLGGNVAPRL